MDFKETLKHMPNLVLAGVVFSSTLLASSEAIADFTWGCGTGNWNDSSCWSSNDSTSSLPTLSDNVYVGNDVSVRVNGNAYAANLNLRAYTSNILLLNGANLTANNEIINYISGYYVSGLTQSGGTNTVSGVLTVNGLGGVGYTLSGGYLSSNNEIIASTFSQSGGIDSVR